MQISGLPAFVYVKRCALHFIVGVAIAFICLMGLLEAIVSILMAHYFLKYQYNEDKWISDKAYPDIAGAIWGMPVGVILFRVFGDSVVHFLGCLIG